MNKVYYGHDAKLIIGGKEIMSISNSDITVHADDRTMQGRVRSIIAVLERATTSLSARDIAEQYLNEVNQSDVLTTGTVCNVLSAAGLLIKSQEQRTQRSFRTKFEMKRNK